MADVTEASLFHATVDGLDGARHRHVLHRPDDAALRVQLPRAGGRSGRGRTMSGSRWAAALSRLTGSRWRSCAPLLPWCWRRRPRRCWSHAAGRGESVRFPPAWSRCTREMHVDGGTELRGARGTVLRAAPDFQGRAIIVVHGAGVVLRDFTIDGNRDASKCGRDCRRPTRPFARFTRNNGILAEDVDGLTVSHVRFRKIAGFAVLVSRSRNVTIVGRRGAGQRIAQRQPAATMRRAGFCSRRARRTSVSRLRPAPDPRQRHLDALALHFAAECARAFSAATTSKRSAATRSRRDTPPGSGSRRTGARGSAIRPSEVDAHPGGHRYGRQRGPIGLRGQSLRGHQRQVHRPRRLPRRRGPRQRLPRAWRITASS